MSVFLIPIQLCEELERIMKKIWWQSNQRRNRGINWTAWDKLCLPKSKGGMGFKKLHETNLALLEPNPGSEDYTVGQLIITGENNWDYNLLVDLFNEEDRRQIMQIPLTSLGREDRMYWIHDKKGAYSVKSGYQLLILDSFVYSHTAMESFWSSLWRYKIPAKVRNLHWRASLNVLPTANQLRAKRVDMDSHCPVCLMHEESIFHVLVSCEFAQQVWKAVGVISAPPWLLISKSGSLSSSKIINKNKRSSL
ncbi:Ribonuclease H-like superfamily protein [Abeliophyllum distichum]|uniref:Ribonuclease H-like superfamily protein n=1 Tax=Abeliophyllum distichum TaxID=126358 RepID=A0ABD1SD92_9LAMI